MEKLKRPKSKQLPIGFLDRHREMIEEIIKQNMNGGLPKYPTITSVVQEAVVQMYEREVTKKK